MAVLPVEPDHLHSHLMNTLHGAVGHPRVPADRKSNYAKVLAILAADQAKMHAQPSQATHAAPGGMGGVQGAEGPATQMVGLPPVPHLGLGGVLPADGPATPMLGQPNLMAVLAGHRFGGGY